MPSNPLVTVIALCYNQRPYVLSFLKNVEEQSYQPIQLIVMDDGSTDGSQEAIQAHCNQRHQAVCHPSNQGIARTLNAALALAKGKYIAISAVDDIWYQDKLKTQVEYFEGLDEKVGIVFSDAFRVDAKGKLLPGLFIAAHRTFDTIPQGDLFSTLFQGNFIPAPSVMVRANCYKKTGFYDENLCYEDWDMWLRMARHYYFAYHPAILTAYRIVPASLTHQLQSSPLPLLQTHFAMHLKWLTWPELTSIQKKKTQCSLSQLAIQIYHEAMKTNLPLNHRKFFQQALKRHWHFKTFLFFLLTFFPLERKIYKMLKRKETR